MVSVATGWATGTGSEPAGGELFRSLSVRDTTTMSGGVAEQRAIVRKRIDYVELLSEQGPLAPRDLVDELDHSRSTVTRALEELREAGLVDRRDDGYSPTVAATMAAQEYRRHEATSRDILESRELLEPLPEAAAPPPLLLAEARTHLTESSAPFRPLETVSDRLRTADDVRAYLPTLVNPALLRVWHRRVTAEGIDSVGLFAEDLLTQLQGQYPGVLGEMSTTDAFSAYTIDGPPYGLLLTTEDDTPTVTMVVYNGEGGVRGVIANDSPAATEWARARFEELEATATPADDEFAPATDLRESAWGIPQTAQRPAPNPGKRRASATEQELPVDLKTEGFVRLSDDYFDAHDEAAPEISWQTGFTLTEVRAGQAVDRVDEDGNRVVERLVGQLRDGGDHVLLGPPGAGKSTTCMAVACDWFEQGLGPVLYRERGRGDEFTSTALLEAYLRQADGHTLVVVEDAIRREANAVFELMQVLGGRDDVTFLLDSRQSEWRGSNEFGLDPRVGAYRRASVREISMPALDEEEYDRFARHFDRLVGAGGEVTPTGDELRSAVDGGLEGTTDDGAEPGTALLAQAQLSRMHTRVSDCEPGGPNALEADIVETFRSLSGARTDIATDLAVLVNLLNAAGIPVAAEYLYALSTDGQYPAVEAAIDSLRGSVLFDREETRVAGTEYRTRHEEWSRRFLEQLLELLPEERAEASFGRCVSRLLSLADDGDRRERIQRHLSTSTPHLHRIETDPREWADEVTERVFTLGQSHSRLAPLYGLTDESAIDLPEACSAFVRHKQAWWRADMNGYQGATERAKSEVERLSDTEATDEGLAEADAKRLRFLGHRGLSMYYRTSGENDVARDHATEALTLAQSLEDIDKIALAHEVLVSVELIESNLESAGAHLEELRELADEHDDPAVKRMAMHAEGQRLLIKGAYDEARVQLRRAVEQAREANGYGTAAYVLSTLGQVALVENDFDLAESSLSSAVDVGRSSGSSMRLCFLYSLLARLALKRGDVEDAEAYLQQAAEREAGVSQLASVRLRSLALVELAQGNLTTAVDIAREAVENAEDVAYPMEQTDTHQTLAQLLIQQGELREAERYLEQSREATEAVGNPVKLATCDRLRARLEFGIGNLDEAERFAHKSLETFVEAEIEDEGAVCRRVLGLVALERGEVPTAREQLTAGLESAEKSGVVRQVARLHEAMVQLETKAGDRAKARRHGGQAIETFERLGDTERAQRIKTRLAE